MVKVKVSFLDLIS